MEIVIFTFFDIFRTGSTYFLNVNILRIVRKENIVPSFIFQFVINAALQ